MDLVSDEYLNDDEGQVASLGLAALTAYVNDDKEQLDQVINDHIGSASSPLVGAQDVVVGVLFTAALLLRNLSKEAGRSGEDILQEIGVMYAERDPDGRV